MNSSSAQNGRCRAVDDFTSINLNLRRLEAERAATLPGSSSRPASRSNEGPSRRGDPGGFDVVCDQPVPEDLGIVDGGGAHVAIRRSPMPRRP
jgi:hypothetical protein